MSITSGERISGKYMPVKEYTHPQNSEVTVQVLGRGMKPVWQELAQEEGSPARLGKELRILPGTPPPRLGG